MTTRIQQVMAAHRKSFSLFVLIGGTTAFIYMSVFAILRSRLYDSLAIVAAYCIAVTFHFSVNRRFAFQGQQRHIIQHLKKYCVLLVINLIVTVVALNVSVNLFYMSPYLSALFSMAMGMAVSYPLARFWVFK